MSEIEALEQDSCPACGALATWSPSKQALICTYCGTEAPTELDRDSGKIREINLAAALRSIPESLRGWKIEKRSVKCRSCQAISVFDPARVGQNCDFCGAPELIDYNEIRSPLRPQSLLPFKIDEAAVRESMRRWYAGKWLAPNALKSRAMLDTVKGLYVPYWTFDARVSSRWRADSGTYYYVNEQFRDSNGRIQARQVQRVRWQPAAGDLSHFFDDEPIPATYGVHPELLRAVEPFPNKELVPYDTAYLAGFAVEHYQVVLIDAAQAARESMTRQLHQLCGAQVPGDTFRNLQVDADWGGETFKHILAPVWLLAYQYGPKSYQVVVNGHTGRVAGEYPKSAWKIALMVLLALVCLLVFVLLSGNG